MAGHLAVELPAHLPKGLFALQLSPAFVEVLQLHSIFVLRCAKGRQLLLHCLLFVATECLHLAQHASLPEDLERISET